jgi:hypothetical protein
MDIPVFVGFAASGPINRPVAITDAAQFAMIFGGDVPLPAPEGSGETRTAHLARAVRGFFRNGGIRCWIVRAAKICSPPKSSDCTRTAVANQFVVPGLFRVTPAGTLEEAVVAARSEGSWSDTLRLRTRLVPTALKHLAVNTALTPLDPRPTIDVTIASSRDISPGDLVRALWINNGAVSATLFLFVEAVTDRLVSPIAGERVVRLSGNSIWTDKSNAAPAQVAPSGRVVVDRLTFELMVENEESAPFVMRDFGFAPSHPRYFGALPSDATLFEDPNQFVEGASPSFKFTPPRRLPGNFLSLAFTSEEGWPDLWREALAPRFPIAAPLDGAAYVPATMPFLFSEEARAVGGGSNDTWLERDGLDVFGPDLFLDPALIDTPARDVINRADTLRYLEEKPEPLVGIHAALSIEEATLLAVPDAVHAGWRRVVPLPVASPPPSSPLSHPEQWRWLDCHKKPAPLPSPPLPGAGFADCDLIEPIPAPFLTASDVERGSFDLIWDTDPNATEVLQEATRGDFADAAVIASGAPGRVRLHSRPPGTYFYRVRRLVGSRTSDWSNGVAVRIAVASGWVAEEDAGEIASLVSIHRAMVRMCAARADMTAILTLPRHYDARLSISHATNLVSALERETWSYGALWHPWMLGRDAEGGELLTSPPDGAIAGTIAARAIARGAWVAPANEPLQSIVALIPEIPPEALQALQDAAVNVLRQEPAGFVCLDADTLSDDETIRPLNVRRLLILLRRAAIRVGNRYVFEPNDETLARAVKRGFEAMLETLFLRGAFAGRTARAAFQVTTDETVNTPRTTESGRFLAEIRVAPSHPLSFLTIRLLQSGDRTVVQEAH